MAGAFNGLEQDLELLVSKGSVGYQDLNRKHESNFIYLKKENRIWVIDIRTFFLPSFAS